MWQIWYDKREEVKFGWMYKKTRKEKKRSKIKMWNPLSRTPVLMRLDLFNYRVYAARAHHLE